MRTRVQARLPTHLPHCSRKITRLRVQARLPTHLPQRSAKITQLRQTLLHRLPRSLTCRSFSNA